MRSPWLLCFFSGFALAEIVEDLPPEIPTSLMVQLSGGFSATFDFTGSTTEKIILNTGTRKLVANLHGCGLTSSIHVANMEVHHVDTHTGKSGDFATLLFDVGTESDIRFGKLTSLKGTHER